MITSNDRDIGIDHDLLACRLDAHVSDGSRGGSNKYDPLLLALFSKLNVFGQESVSGVNCLSAYKQN